MIISIRTKGVFNVIYYAHNIRQLRKEKGLTQSKLAENITSQGVISKIEKEIISPDIKTLQAIADKLNISLHDLLFESTEKNMLQQFYSQVNILLDQRDYPGLKSFITDHPLFQTIKQNNPCFYNWITGIINIRVYDQTDKGISNFKQGLENCSDLKLKSRILIALSNTYSDLNNYEEAIDYLSQAEDLSKNGCVPYNMQIIIYYHQALMFAETNNYKDSIFKSKQAIQFIIDHQSLQLLDDLQLLLGDSYKEIGKLNLALEHTQTALTIAKLKNNVALLPYIERTLLQIEEQMTSK